MTPATGLVPSLKRLARSGLARVPVDVWSRLLPRDIVGLCYHLVSDQELPHQLLYPFKTAAQFEADVRHVASRAIGYQQVSALRRGELRLPSNRYLVTFDDGFAQCFDVARPILARHRVPAMFFVNVDFLDDRRPFFEATVSACLRHLAGLEVERAAEALARLDRPSGTEPDRELAGRRLRSARVRLPATVPHQALAVWVLGFQEDQGAELARVAEALGLPAGAVATKGLFMTSDQVRRMAGEEGFTIGSHGFTHLPMQRLDPEAMERAIVGSCAALRDLTGQRSVPFAFPYGGVGIDRARLAELLRKHPFIDLFFDAEAFQRDEPFVVQRLASDEPPDPGDLRSNLPALLGRAWSHRSAWYRGR